MVLAIFHPQKGPVLNSTQTAAKQLLREVLTPQGFLASPVEHTNYRRLWARDGIMCGLVGLAIDDSELIGGLRDHLLSLAAHQGPSGEIPSNLSFDSKAQVQELSYGSLVGRVDAATWFVVGACQYMLSHNDSNTEALLKPGVEKARELIRAWQFNGRGLIYVPQGGNWADDYLLEGYTLYDQVMNLWAGISWQSFSGQKGEAANWWWTTTGSIKK